MFNEVDSQWLWSLSLLSNTTQVQECECEQPPEITVTFDDIDACGEHGLAAQIAYADRCLLLLGDFFYVAERWPPMNVWHVRSGHGLN